MRLLAFFSDFISFLFNTCSISQLAMSSQTFLQRPPVCPASFPLSKFSFATVSGELVKPIPWRHIPDKGHLFAVFENVTTTKRDGEVEEKSLFKVLAEAEILVFRSLLS